MQINAATYSFRQKRFFLVFEREVIRPDVMEEVIVSCVIKHLSLVDALQSLVNYQYREDHTEEYDLLCKIMAETFKKINAMERQLQVSSSCFSAFFGRAKSHVPLFGRQTYVFSHKNTQKRTRPTLK